MGSNISYFDYVNSVYGYDSYNEIIELLISGEIEEPFDIKKVIDYYEEEEKKRIANNKNNLNSKLGPFDEDNVFNPSDKVELFDNEYTLELKNSKVRVSFYVLQERIFQYIVGDELKYFEERYNKIKNISEYFFKTFGSFILDFISECSYYDNSYIKYYESIDKNIDIIRKYVSVRDIESHTKHAKYIPKSFFKVLIEESKDNPVEIFNGVTQRLKRDAEFLKELYDVDPIACVEICKKNNLNWNLFLEENKW